MKQMFVYIVLCFVVQNFILSAAFAWEIDFSRREKYMRKTESQPLPITQAPTETPAPLTTNRIINDHTPANDVVILNTENGFVPKSLALRKGVKYKVHVVNVNEKEKNVSFIMGSFQQHHGTYYGQIKSFEVTPQTEGIYTFQCPETALEGRVVILPQVEDDRGLASE